MKVGIVILCLVVILSGCSRGFRTQEEGNNFIRICSVKEDLKGLTQKQIKDMLGEPDSTETSYVYDNLKQAWSYINMYGKVKLTFINGVVMEAEYN